MAHRLGRLLRGAALLTGSGAAILTVINYKKNKLACSDKPITPWDYNWDRRAPAPDSADSTDGEKPRKATASRHLVLIRHGQYDMSQKEDELRVLTELGHQQAAITGKRLNELQNATKKKFNLIIHSTMKRAIETSDDIIKELGVVPQVKSCDLLREGSPCRPEPPSSSWKPETHQFYQEGARIEAAFRKYFHRASVDQKEDTIDVIICHGNVIRYFVCRFQPSNVIAMLKKFILRYIMEHADSLCALCVLCEQLKGSNITEALQLPPEAWLRLSLAHCSITHIIIRPSGRVSLKGLGDAGHLPARMVTYT